MSSTAELLPGPFADGDRPALIDVVADLMPRLDADLPAGSDLVVLADGLGWELLQEHLSLAPTLRSRLEEISPIRTVAPATTATAMTSLLTGLPPVRHGVLGYTVLDPSGGPAVNQLTGDPSVDPREWMPRPVLGETSSRRALHAGPAKHQGSHLSRLAYRGWGFQTTTASRRIDEVRTALHRAGPHGLVLLHLDDIDHAGHRHGVDSDAWREALGDVDSLLAALLRRLRPGTRIHLVADHGMVDADPGRRIDPTQRPGVGDLVGRIAGESRALWIAARPGKGAAEELVEALRNGLEGDALVLSREDVIARGILGPCGEVPDERVAARMGDVLVLARGRASLVDPTRPTPRHPEIGMHGSLTARESLVPHLVLEV